MRMVCVGVVCVYMCHVQHETSHFSFIVVVWVITIKITFARRYIGCLALEPQNHSSKAVVFEAAAVHPFAPHFQIAQIQEAVTVRLLESLPSGGARRSRLVAMELLVDSIERVIHPLLSGEACYPDASALPTFPAS